MREYSFGHFSVCRHQLEEVVHSLSVHVITKQEDCPEPAIFLHLLSCKNGNNYNTQYLLYNKNSEDGHKGGGKFITNNPRSNQR